MMFDPVQSAYVQQAEETEQDLIDRAANAVEKSNWIIGECAARWTELYAKGRTDADFAKRIGSSQQRVNQCRLVHERMGGYKSIGNLTWTHCQVALAWDDAAECLKWAAEMQATVAEMKAWRRAQRGEDLAEASDDDSEEKNNPEGEERGRAPARANRNAPTTSRRKRSDKARKAETDPPARVVAEKEPTLFLSEERSVDATLSVSAIILGLREASRAFEAAARSEEEIDELGDELQCWLGRLGKKRATPPARTFTPPTVAEVKAYCQERENNIDAENFVDFYQSKGWMVGKNKMSDWKAAVRTWERSGLSRAEGATPTGAGAFDEVFGPRGGVR